MANPKLAVIAGASGFVGQHLLKALKLQGYGVAIIGRNGPDATWEDKEGIFRLVDGADLIVNLAGRSVGCRYNNKNRNEIFDSRIDTTKLLREAVAAAENPPRLWMNASTGTIYRHAEDHPQTEAEGELGSGFSVDVARNWEAELFEGELPETRRVALRMAIVLGEGPALQKLAGAARFGLGGPNIDGWWFNHNRYRGIGPNPTENKRITHKSKGSQRFSWIHIDDLVSTIEFIDTNESISGPVNCAAPEAATNRHLMELLRKQVRTRFYLPTFRWMLEIGMLFIRQESELLLKSRWVEPEVLLNAGFEFEWPDLETAIADLA